MMAGGPGSKATLTHSTSMVRGRRGECQAGAGTTPGGPTPRSNVPVRT